MDIFKKRRDQLTALDPDGVFLFASAPVDENYSLRHRFRQDSNFYYFTGFDEPNAFVAISPNQMTLWLRPRDPNVELWEGERLGLDRAVQKLGAHAVYPIDQLKNTLSCIFHHSEKVYFKLKISSEMSCLVVSAMEEHFKSQMRLGKCLLPIHDPSFLIGELRLFKDAQEIEWLKKASEISALAHQEILSFVKPGMNEFEVQARIDYLFQKAGCRQRAYATIIAGGHHATCLHYTKNNAPLQPEDLLLIDAGGEYEYYAADITRTFPVNRKFSSDQKNLYSMVLKVQKSCIERVKPGVTLPELHDHVCELLTEGLLELGILKGQKAKLLEDRAYRKFFPHGTSHWLGMDVHDAGCYVEKDGSPRKLKPGMVFTIEPGFYAQTHDASVDPKYKGIGIRIEDDILVTEQGYEVMSVKAPKEIHEIEL